MKSYNSAFNDKVSVGARLASGLISPKVDPIMPEERKAPIKTLTRSKERLEKMPLRAVVDSNLFRLSPERSKSNDTERLSFSINDD